MRLKNHEGDKAEALRPVREGSKEKSNVNAKKDAFLRHPLVLQDKKISFIDNDGSKYSYDISINDVASVAMLPKYCKLHLRMKDGSVRDVEATTSVLERVGDRFSKIGFQV